LGLEALERFVAREPLRRVHAYSACWRWRAGRWIHGCSIVSPSQKVMRRRRSSEGCPSKHHHSTEGY
jgi:hypothetical protein